jgi:sugar lactone lactonase YvrE
MTAPFRGPRKLDLQSKETPDMSDVELVIAARDDLGEGPLWHPEEQAIYWTDIEEGRYHRLHPASGQHDVVQVGEKVGVLGFRQQGGLVMATNRGFSFFDPAAGRLEHLGDPEADKPETQFNDGAVDRAGRFWAGTLGDSFKNSLYRLDPGGTIHCMETGLDISNGIGWSPDNRTLYLVDSTPGVVYAYDFDLDSGSIANRRVLTDRQGRPGIPDGLTVDASGGIWIAIWDGACLEQLDPSGQLVQQIQLPVQYPTSMAFGGPNLDELYITSALYEYPREERHKYPLDGSLFRIRGLATGLPEPLFAG